MKLRNQAIFRGERDLSPEFIFAAVAAIYTFMFIVYPYALDDLLYRGWMRNFMRENSNDTIWQGIMFTWRTLAENANVRMSNQMFVLVSVLPKWVGCTLSGLALWYSMRKAGRLADPAGPDVMTAIWVCILFTFLLPWQDYLFLTDFQLNYIWSMAISIWIAGMFFDGKKHSPVPLFFAGLLCGLWHEGFAIPLGCGIGVLAMIRRDRRTLTSVIACCAGLLVGVLWLLFCPATQVRIGEAKHVHQIGRFSYMNVIKSNPGAIILVVMTCVALCRKSARKLLREPLFIFLAVNILANLCIHLCVNNGPRVSFWGNLCAVIAIIYLGRRMWPASPRLLWRTFSWCAFLLTAVSLGVAAVATDRIRRDADAIYAAFERSTARKVTIFKDVLTLNNAPAIAFYKPGYLLFCHSAMMNPAEWYYGEDRRFSVVPKCLEYIDENSGEKKTSGARHIGEIWFVENTIGIKEPIMINGKVTVGNRTLYREIYAAPFVSRGDGRKYLWLHPGIGFGAFGRPVADIDPSTKIVPYDYCPQLQYRL